MHLLRCSRNVNLQGVHGEGIGDFFRNVGRKLKKAFNFAKPHLEKYAPQLKDLAKGALPGIADSLKKNIINSSALNQLAEFEHNKFGTSHSTNLAGKAFEKINDLQDLAQKK